MTVCRAVDRLTHSRVTNHQLIANQELRFLLPSVSSSSYFCTSFFSADLRVITGSHIIIIFSLLMYIDGRHLHICSIKATNNVNSMRLEMTVHMPNARTLNRLRHLANRIQHGLHIHFASPRAFVFEQMSPMRLLVCCLLLVGRSSSMYEQVYHVQPQMIRINDWEPFYMTSEKNEVGQVLYRDDRIEFACECRAPVDPVPHRIVWLINNSTVRGSKNASSIRLIINSTTVQAPVSVVRCRCIFTLANSSVVPVDYRYFMHIGRTFGLVERMT